jgi:hypothetical protein
MSSPRWMIREVESRFATRCGRRLTNRIPKPTAILDRKRVSLRNHGNRGASLGVMKRRQPVERTLAHESVRIMERVEQDSANPTAVVGTQGWVRSQRHHAGERGTAEMRVTDAEPAAARSNDGTATSPSTARPCVARPLVLHDVVAHSVAATFRASPRGRVVLVGSLRIR